jgi:hypothetical protein
MYDYTGSIWSHQNSNKRFKEKSGSHTMKTFNRLTTKTAVLVTSHIIQKVLQSERWASQLVEEEKYRGEKDCDRRHNDDYDKNNRRNE